MSLLQKSLNHEYTRKRPIKLLLLRHSTVADALPLADKEGLKLLRQISRRVDKDLRERKDQVSALLAVIHFEKAGVLREHLPILPSARILAGLAETRRIKSSAQAELVLAVLKNNDLVSSIGAHAEALASAYDIWHQPRVARRKRADA